MHVIATAGHVDHGKSTLVRALTGMEPDRWAEERRRGMTIDLGFAWTTLPSGETLAFVDVPGHERFVPNMLAGVGPVPAAMVVVAADEGWMPQSAEHLAALDALGVRHGLLVVTRSDLADPAPATAGALARIAGTSLGAIEAVAVSGTTGAGLGELRAALDRLVAALPPPGTEAPVRLWIDRVFTVKGAGTVVTGTLGAGRLRVNDELDGRLRIRGLQSLGRPCDEVTGVARVAVNLRGVDRDSIGRGDALLSPGRFRTTEVIDVRAVAGLPATAMLHVGSAAVPVRVRPLGADTARLRLGRALPLRIGDRGVLRDPGLRQVLGGVTVLDVAPPALSRRGAAAARAGELAGMSGVPDLAGELRRRRVVRRVDLVAMGVTVPGGGPWLLDPSYRADVEARLLTEVDSYVTKNPLESGIPAEVLRRRLDLPDRALVETLLSEGVRSVNGRIFRYKMDKPEGLSELIAKAFAPLGPFAAPEANDLSALGIGPKQQAAAVRTGLAIQIAPGVLLRPGAADRAAAALAGLPQPFTLSEARRALGTTRRVAVPLLESLDRSGRTERMHDDRRTVTRPERFA